MEPSSIPIIVTQEEHRELDPQGEHRESDPLPFLRQEERETSSSKELCLKFDRLDGPNLLTYSRRQHGDAILPPQLSNPEVSPTVSPSSYTNGNHSLSDLDLPIAARKSFRKCTQHPISNFVFYDSLSPFYCAFVSTLSSLSIPQCWQDAIHEPKWRSAMGEEMNALKKSGT